MKELDFDELDRAVNSLMSNVPKDEPSKDDNVKTVTLPASDPAVSPSVTPSISSSSTGKPAPVPATTTPTRNTGSVATRRSGRFMDVMHPSATSKKSEQPTKNVSRQGATVEPLSTSDASAAVSMKEETASPAEMPKEAPDASPTLPTVPEQPVVTSHQPQPKSDWPDPLDFQKSQQKADTLPPDESSVESEKQPAEPAPSKQDESDAPLTSPFLPDAKVEKRPLGATASGLQEAPVAALPIAAQGKEDLTPHDPNDQLPPSPTDTAPPLPEELQQDLVAIESGTHQAEELKTEPSASDEKTEEVTVKERPPTPTTEASNQEPAKTETESDAKSPEPIGPVSIPQQYKEEPSTGDKENGSIYDTDTYHQPLAHPAKKKSGWLWVIWILLILVVGAGAGAALYLTGII